VITDYVNASQGLADPDIHVDMDFEYGGKGPGYAVQQLLCRYEGNLNVISCCVLHKLGTKEWPKSWWVDVTSISPLGKG
jgi:hypothetical protein